MESARIHRSQQRKINPHVLFALLLATSAAADETGYAAARRAMVEEVQAHAQLSRDTDERPLSPRVMQALATVKRHEFVRPRQQRDAYENRPLPIGFGQTISQPYIVALMTNLIEPKVDDRVLEIGTGSGYQAAILAGLVSRVYTMEIIEPLLDRARAQLQRLGYDNVTPRLGDGYYGWAEHAPYDAIVVTAAASHVPPPLIEQLRPGGEMIIPVGSQFAIQHLLLITKTETGEIYTRQVAAVRFVPLTGRH